MSSYGFYASKDGELFEIGPCKTEFEAIQSALDNDIGYDYEYNDNFDKHLWKFCVIQAVQYEVNLAEIFNIESYIDSIEECLFENDPMEIDDCKIDLKLEEINDLESKIKETIKNWQINNNYHQHYSRLSNCSKEKWYVFKADSDDSKPYEIKDNKDGY